MKQDIKNNLTRQDENPIFNVMDKIQKQQLHHHGHHI
jgi:hypothetical protein